ncbi:unnamed protein product [Menidia menidia]|uniref:(Atlantic silverside) hypothetical protein n=1 Tax=Menidia menidia TaxID=238744 RepID=A0A8S4BCH8_9TELE|nr:unnamed protein product [Menidia menidia]
MDEDDSQDELINPSTSHNKGKRAAVWAISDDSDDLEAESNEGESDSDDEDEDDQGNGEEEEEYDEVEEEEEEEEDEEDADPKPEDGAFGGTSADVTGMSSDEDSDKCPICLNSFSSQPVATPESCEHYFCFDCILEWAKNANSCPVDRIAFSSIYLRKCYGGKVKKIVTVQKPAKASQEETVDLDLEQTNCEVCGGSDREDRLLLCDGCDAGYHMECLTPPLDSVPVEEWFCPECEAHGRHSRGSAEELSDADSLPSTARPATSQSRPRAAGPTRAIARTQQSERVRANVNRHRITQARTSQLAPTYLMQSTWLDETINAVVAGLNTAVYVRDLTPRAHISSRRRSGKRRKVKRKKTSAAKGKNGRMASTGVRRKRRVRRTKSRKKLWEKKTATPRSRIANNLGIVKNKKSSSLPTVYRPSEHTLSNMRADIGAASLSIYGDPFDLDPFVEREEEEQQARVTSLLEARRRGISHSALRSHQPVARPVTASLSRRGVNVQQPGAVVEATPVPDLLGSILSGQSMLLMDSSDVVISRDGSLKATKPLTPSPSLPCNRSNDSSGDASALINPEISPNVGDSYIGDLPGSSNSPVNRHLTPDSSHLSSFTPFLSNQTQPTPHPDVPQRRNPSFQSCRPNRSTPPPCRLGINELGAPRAATFSSVESNLKSKDMASSQFHKPMWAQRHRSDGASSSSAFSSSSSSSSSGNSASQPRYTSSSSSSSAVSFRINSSGNSWQARRLNMASSSVSGSFMQEQGRKKEDEAKKKQLHKDKQMLLASRSKEQDSDNIYDPFNPTLSDSSSSGDEADSINLNSSPQRVTHEQKTSPFGNKGGSAVSRWDLVPVKTESQEVKVSQEEPGSSQNTTEMKLSGDRIKVEQVSKLADVKDETQSSLDIKVKREPKIEDTEESQSCGGSIGSYSNSERANSTPPAHHSLDQLKAEKEAQPDDDGQYAGVSHRSQLNHRDNASTSRSAASKKKPRDSTSSSRFPSRDSDFKRQTSKASNEQQCSSSDTDIIRREHHHASGLESKKKERDKDKDRTTSDSSQPKSPDRAQRNGGRRRSQSRSRDETRKRRSRSRSSSSSRERSRRKKQRSNERNDRKGKDHEGRRASKEERRGRSRSRSKSRSRSPSRSKNNKPATARSESTSGSRERRKDTKMEHSSLPSRNKVKSHIKDQNRRRSRSSSREKRKEGRSSRAAQKTSGVSSSMNQSQEQKKEKLPSRKNIKEEKCVGKVIKKEFPSQTCTPQIKKEEGNCQAESQATTPETTNDIKNFKEVKEEKQLSLDMKGSPISKPIKTEEKPSFNLELSKNIEAKEKPIKTNTFEMAVIKSEPLSSLITPVSADSHRDTPSPPQAVSVDSAELPVPVKQESLDSDEDFNVDVMLDNLEYAKSQHTEGRGTTVKQEKEQVEGKEGGEQATAATGAKSKTQVKRVTWNIQEPEGPKSVKIAGKLALYKLKLKQEGARRPAFPVQTSSQDIAEAVIDPSKKEAVSLHRGELPPSKQGEVEEEDLSRKDKYLKKLHMQERAIEEVKLAIKPFYQRRDINKEEYKEILRKAVQKVCHSKSGEINPVKVGNLVKAYVDKYKHARKHKKGEDSGKVPEAQTEAMEMSDSP